MIEGPEHEKVWRTSHADGTTSYHSIRTAQPSVHALYRQWTNIIDLHNKLRQGVTSMSDVWGTQSWEERHFAEGLGFWEVN
eukprot:1701325-Pleurochrysis_carterae.AAC.1